MHMYIDGSYDYSFVKKHWWKFNGNLNKQTHGEKKLVLKSNFFKLLLNSRDTSMIFFLKIKFLNTNQKLEFFFLINYIESKMGNLLLHLIKYF